MCSVEIIDTRYSNAAIKALFPFSKRMLFCSMVMLVIAAYDSFD